MKVIVRVGPGGVDRDNGGERYDYYGPFDDSKGRDEYTPFVHKIKQALADAESEHGERAFPSGPVTITVIRLFPVKDDGRDTAQDAADNWTFDLNLHGMEV